MLHRRSFLFLLKERLIFGFLAEKQARKNKSREKSEQRGQRNRSVSEENARQIKSRRGNERKRKIDEKKRDASLFYFSAQHEYKRKQRSRGEMNEKEQSFACHLKIFLKTGSFFPAIIKPRNRAGKRKSFVLVVVSAYDEIFARNCQFAHACFKRDTVVFNRKHFVYPGNGAFFFIYKRNLVRIVCPIVFHN